MEGLDGASEILGEKENLLSYRDRFRDFHPDAVIDCIGRLKIGRSMQVSFGAGPGLPNPLRLKNRWPRRSLGSDKILPLLLPNKWNAGSGRTRPKTDGWRTRLRLAA